MRPGDTLNHGAYRIERELGAGGFGAVYLADEIALRRKVAIKTILPEVVAREPRAAEVFYAEARLTARLAHPYILPIYFVGEEATGGQSLPYIVMEYVDGGDLETILAKTSVDLRRRLRWMQQIAEGLGYAHEQGVLHRDLKPRNVFVTRHQTPKIGDFGLAKALGGETQTVLKGLGTPAYISPEQIQGHASDARADLYALGVMYYQMLTGRLPYDAPDVSDLAAKIMAIGYQHVHGPIPMAHAVNPEVPPELDGLVQRLMAKVPGARPASATEVAQALESLLQSGPRTSIPLPPPTITGSQAVADSPQPSIAATQAAMGSTQAASASTQATPSSSRAAIAPTQAVVTSTRGLGTKWLALLAALLILGVGAFFLWPKMAFEVAAPPRSPIAQPSPPTQDAPKSAGAVPAELARTKPEEDQRQVQADGEVARKRAEEARVAKLREEQRRQQETKKPSEREQTSPKEEAARKQKEEEVTRQKAEEARLAKLREEQRQQQEAKRAEEERQAKAQGEPIAWLENAFRKAGFKDLTVAVSPDRIVTLTGAVQDQRQRDEAIRLANLGPGVKEVRSNLTVVPAAPAPADPEAIRREVEQRFRDNGLKDLTVAVSPDRVATLSGTVPDKRQGDEAIRLARLVPEVREVRPNIIVVSPPPAPEEVQSLVEQRLRDNGLNLKVEVTPDRSIRLIGAVDSAEKKDQAMKLASGVAGVTRVRDGIFVVPQSSGPMKIQKTQ